jgi:hypothetical protein
VRTLARLLGGMACAAAVFVGGPARAELPAEATSWNQLGEPARSGLAQGSTTVATHLALVEAGGPRTLRLGFSFDHMLRDRWGVVGGVAAPFAGVLFAPVHLGVRFHALARSPIDPYATAYGGVALLHPEGEKATLEPVVGANLGLAYHYWGFAFLGVDFGLEHASYASVDSGRILGLTTYVMTWRSGVRF